jgi:hypothetical protein
MIFPLYYVPPGVVPPKHVAGYHSTIAVLRPGAAPNGVPEEIAAIPDPTNPERKIGGHLIGGDLTDQVRGMFTKTDAGWWIAMGNIKPESLARVRGIGGTCIPGIDPEHEWCVPTLLHISNNKDGPRRLTSAIPAIYKDYQWQNPAEFNAVIDRLGNYLRAEETPPREEALALAVDILSINYHLSVHEIAIAGWFNEEFLLRVITAAVDFSE